jgi:competence protein ComEC
VILVGVPPSAVRAGIMSILILFSLSVGRMARLINIVIITAAATLVFNPLLLGADIGWQLSFAAVLGLIYLYPLIKKLLDRIIWKRLAWLGDIIAATLAAQFSTTPISLYHFGQVSLISPLANILVVWTIFFLTAASAIAIPLAAIFPALGNIFFLPSFIIAKYIMWIASILSLPSWAAFSIGE